MAASVTTPIRKVSELSNESPLPTPPQAMHDLIRNGRVARTSHVDDGHSHFDSYPAPLTDKQLHFNGIPLDDLDPSERRHGSSSPSARATGQRAARGLAATTAAGSSTSGLGRASPGSLAASMGTSLAQHRGHGLGNQMGIQDTDLAGSIPSSAATTNNVLRSSNRPGNLASQRSTSYESAHKVDRGTNGHEGRLSGRSSLKSLGSAAVAKDKENVEQQSMRSNARAQGDQQVHMPVAGRRSGNLQPTRSPSPDARTDAKTNTAFTRSTYRRSSAEQEAARAGQGDVLRRSSDEGAASAPAVASRRSAMREAQSAQAEEPALADSVSRDNHFQTPGLSVGSRVLRSGQAGRQTAAPWSVGRSIKRIDRNTGLDKPPQRIVAPQEEQEDDEVEEGKAEGMPSPIAEEGNSILDRQHAAESGRSGSGSGSGSYRPIDHDYEVDRLRGNGSDGSGGRDVRLLKVPLGADEDEEEEDVFHDVNRMAASRNESAFRRGMRPAVQSSAEPQAQRRRAAISDIMSAKVPADAVPPRRVLAHALDGLPTPAINGVLDVGARGPAAAQPTPRTVSDFMMLVRQEAVRQRGVPFLEQLSAKPSKDLETKFNGYKFKKIRKAGEGGFSTVWVVRGPFAAPDPLTPGAYIDVPESDQAYFAMKQVTLKKMEQVSREEVLEECNLLQSLASKPNNEDFILRFFGWKSSTGSLKILLELGEHDFNQILRAQRLSRTQIVTYWYQMLQAVHFTHEEGNIVHTDLKPANFLMANGRLKLIDFGIAQKIPVGTIHIKRDAMIGTPNYMAPETVRAVKEGRNGRPRDTSGVQAATARVYKAGKASDVWALGCILYQMVYSRPPFEAFHGDDKLRAILDPNHKIDFAPVRYGPPKATSDAQGQEEAEDDDEDDGELEAIDPDLLDVLRLTLGYSATERVTIPQLLQHPLLRPLEQQRLRQKAHSSGWLDDEQEPGYDEEDEEDGTVPVSRGTLRDILRKMYIFARNGELHDDNLDARADALFENMLLRHQNQR